MAIAFTISHYKDTHPDISSAIIFYTLANQIHPFNIIDTVSNNTFHKLNMSNLTYF